VVLPGCDILTVKSALLQQQTNFTSADGANSL